MVHALGSLLEGKQPSREQQEKRLNQHSSFWYVGLPNAVVNGCEWARVIPGKKKKGSPILSYISTPSKSFVTVSPVKDQLGYYGVRVCLMY